MRHKLSAMRKCKFVRRVPVRFLSRMFGARMGDRSVVSRRYVGVWVWRVHARDKTCRGERAQAMHMQAEHQQAMNGAGQWYDPCTFR